MLGSCITSRKLPSSCTEVRKSFFISSYSIDGVTAQVKPMLMVKPSNGLEKGKIKTTTCSQVDSGNENINDFKCDHEKSVFDGLNTIAMLRKWRKREK